MGLSWRLCGSCHLWDVCYFLWDPVTPMGTVGSQSDFPDLDSRDFGHKLNAFTSLSGKPRPPWQVHQGSPEELSKTGQRSQLLQESPAFRMDHDEERLWGPTRPDLALGGDRVGGKLC